MICAYFLRGDTAEDERFVNRPDSAIEFVRNVALAGLLPISTSCQLTRTRIYELFRENTIGIDA
jgi:hypothetical protein